MIETNNVLLRPLVAEDAPHTLELRHDLDANQVSMGHPFPVNIENEREWISNLYTGQQRENIYLAIVHRETSLFLGYLSARKINTIDRTAWFGIFINKESRRKGYSSEAMTAFLNYLHQVFNLRKILLEVQSRNQKAINLFEKVGFKEEGLLKNQVWSDGKFQDVMVMSIFLEENQR